MIEQTPDASEKERKAGTSCSGVKRDGARCNAPALGGSRFCVAHDPAKVTQLASWRAAGGKAKSNAARAKKTLGAATLSNEELDAVLCNTLAKLVRGQLPPAVGTSAAALVKALIEVRKTGQFAEQLADVERLIKDGAAS